MGTFLTRQPNGLLCRFSTVTYTVYYNMTDEEYIEMCAEEARQEARNILKSNLKPLSSIGDTAQNYAVKLCSYCKYYKLDKNTYICTNEKSENFNINTAPFQHCSCFSENKKHVAKEVMKNESSN